MPTNTDEYEVRSAAIVERDKDGHLHVPEGDDTMAGVGTAGGSLIGMLVGVLGGPVGMLLGWGAGAAGGALYDADRLDTGDEAIEQFGTLVPVKRRLSRPPPRKPTRRRARRSANRRGRNARKPPSSAWTR